MSEETPREQAFWKLVQALDESNVLPYVMFIGTWAEWLYADLLPKSPDGSDHRIDIGKTYDIDVYFRERFLEIDGAEQLISIMQSAGFVRDADIRKVRLLLVIMESLPDQMADLKRLLENLGENEEATIRNVAAKNNLHLP